MKVKEQITELITGLSGIALLWYQTDWMWALTFFLLYTSVYQHIKKW